MSFPCKIIEQFRLCPAKLWSNADFAPQNNRALVLCPAKLRSIYSLPRKLWRNADFAPQNQRDIVSVAKIPPTIFFKLVYLFFSSKSTLFQKSLKQLGPFFYEKVFGVTVPLNYFEDFYLANTEVE